MDTKFGIEAKEGDYCLVLDINYMCRRAVNLPAKVYKNKAYTGIKNMSKGKYIHKLTAECKIPAEAISEDDKRRIEEDIECNNKKYKNPYKEDNEKKKNL